MYVQTINKSNRVNCVIKDVSSKDFIGGAIKGDVVLLPDGCLDLEVFSCSIATLRKWMLERRVIEVAVTGSDINIWLPNNRDGRIISVDSKNSIVELKVYPERLEILANGE